MDNEYFLKFKENSKKIQEDEVFVSKKKKAI